MPIGLFAVAGVICTLASTKVAVASPEFAAVLFVQCIDAPLRGIGGRASAGQHQMLGAVRGQVSGDFQSDRSQPAGHQICCVIAQFERGSTGLPVASNQPGHIDILITQRDLVFPDGRVARRRDPVDEPRPFVGSAFTAF